MFTNPLPGPVLTQPRRVVQLGDRRVVPYSDANMFRRLQLNGAGAAPERPRSSFPGPFQSSRFTRMATFAGAKSGSWARICAAAGWNRSCIYFEFKVALTRRTEPAWDFAYSRPNDAAIDVVHDAPTDYPQHAFRAGSSYGGGPAIVPVHVGDRDDKAGDTVSMASTLQSERSSHRTLPLDDLDYKSVSLNTVSTPGDVDNSGTVAARGDSIAPCAAVSVNIPRFPCPSHCADTSNDVAVPRQHH